jgi:DNA-binding winged helix-turn-helix (wHTH) protein/TolB-like protein
VLTHAGEPVPLAPKLFDLLVLLVQASGRLVTRERVVEAIWPGVFVSETNLRQKVWLLRKALKAAAGAPATYIGTVPRRGYRFLMPVTVDAHGAPAGSLLPGKSGAGALARARRSVRWLSALALALATTSDRAPSSMPSVAAASPASSQVRRSVALLPLRTHSGDPEDGWIAAAFTEMLRAELSLSHVLRLVPADTTERLVRELAPPPVLTLSARGLSRVRQKLGGDWVVSGALVAAGPHDDAGLRVDLLVQCTESREILATVTRSGTRGELTRLASRAGSELRRALGAAEARAAAARQHGSPQTSS